MKRILCFGDSLTHGTKPTDESVPRQRYDQSKRWTGLLQSGLETEATIIEEGLPSRTIDKDDARPGKIGRNGSVYLWPCIESHVPLDVVIVWLGTNDTKDMFDASAEEIAASYKQMLVKLRAQLDNDAPGCRIIIMSPPQMNAASEGARSWYGHAQPKLAALPGLYQQIATELNLDFIDLYPLLGEPAIPDGIHLSEEQNVVVAELVIKKLTEMGVAS